MNFTYLKNFFVIILFTVFCGKSSSSPRFYLLTIGEDKEAYAMYGHTAIRVVDSTLNMDFTIDWGVFNFNQPNFYLNFAKGDMFYSMSTQNYSHFLNRQYYENRGLISQEILLNDAQKEQFWSLISWNLQPENRDYYYKFIRDNCATRPRDLIEATLGENLLYPANSSENLTFRDILHQYQQPHAWYNLLIDIILGSPIDQKASFREQMFIPEYLSKNLSQALVQDGLETHPLLSETTVIIEKKSLPQTMRVFIPEIVCLVLFFVILALNYLKKGSRFLRFFDVLFFGIIIFFGLLLLALWMFSNHIETYENYNLFWLNPLFIFPLIALMTKKHKTWMIVTACYTGLFGILATCGVFPQKFPTSMYLILLIVLERCYFGWRDQNNSCKKS